MPTMMSTIGEAAGLKPDDAVIGLGAVAAAKSKAQGYMMAVLGSTTPELRHILTTQMNQVLAEHEKMATLAAKKGWYIHSPSPDVYVQQAVDFTKPVLEQ